MSLVMLHIGSRDVNTDNLPSQEMCLNQKRYLYASLLMFRNMLVFLTLTYLSQPAETMMGLLVLGENRTQLTQSWWPSSVIVYLHWASVFHSLIVLSRAAETICLLSAENA